MPFDRPDPERMTDESQEGEKKDRGADLPIRDWPRDLEPLDVNFRKILHRTPGGIVAFASVRAGAGLRLGPYQV